MIDKMDKMEDIKITYIESEEDTGLGTSKGPAALTLFKNIDTGSNIEDVRIDVDCYRDIRFNRYIWNYIKNKLTESEDRSSILEENYRIFKEFIRKHKRLGECCVKDGAIYVYHNEDNYKKAKKKLENSEDYEILTLERLREIEPCMKEEKGICGGIFSRHDGYINCNDFMRKLTENLRESKRVEFRFNCDVRRIENREDMVYIEYIENKKEVSEYFDKVILCTGHRTAELLSEIDGDIKYKLYPLKGYSITVPNNIERELIPKYGIIYKDKVKFLRSYRTGECNENDNENIGARIGGIIHFDTKYNTKDAYKIDNNFIKKEFKDTEIGKYLYEQKNKILWSGYRPESYNGRAIVKKYKNIYVNTGYGTNGFVLVWKASKEVVKSLNKSLNKKEIIENENENILMQNYLLIILILSILLILFNNIIL